MEEIWKDIKGYEGLYQVSNLGRVKSFHGRTEKEKILQPNNKSKYSQLLLVKDKKRKIAHVHRLVAEAFIPNTENKPQVNHKDENRKNNRVDNLEWCDCSYNIIYSQGKKVLQYDKDGNFIKEWDCMRDAERQLGINCTNISACCRRKHKCRTAGGYIWRYKEAE